MFRSCGILISIFLLILFSVSEALAKQPAGIAGNVTVVNDETTPVPVSHPPMTHMRQTPQDHVNLEGFSDSACETGLTALKSIFADGTRGDSAFFVPPGKVLVITDFSAVVRGFLTLAGRIAEVQLYAGSNLVFRRGITISSEAGSQEIAAVTVAIRSGVIIGAGETPCVRGGITFNSGGGIADILSVSIQGYLIEE